MPRLTTSLQTGTTMAKKLHQHISNRKKTSCWYEVNIERFSSEILS